MERNQGSKSGGEIFDDSITTNIKLIKELLEKGNPNIQYKFEAYFRNLFNVLGAKAIHKYPSVEMLQVNETLEKTGKKLLNALPTEEKGQEADLLLKDIHQTIKHNEQNRAKRDKTNQDPDSEGGKILLKKLEDYLKRTQ